MPLFVAKPSLPKLSDFNQEIKKIYKTHKLTTNGPQVNLLEKKLKISRCKKSITCIKWYNSNSNCIGNT